MATLTLGTSTLKPLGDRILVRIAAVEEKTAGGIVLPDTAQEKPQVGEVVQLGKGERREDGSYLPIDVEIGDRVLFSKYSGTDVRLEGSDHVLLREKDILAKLA